MKTHLDNLLFNYGIDKLMSLVKYPSILTYHELGERGTLNDKINGEDFAGKTVYATEKIDGSNSFICFTTNNKGCAEDYFIGSRTEPLYFNGDRIIVNKSQGIVETLKPAADHIMLFVDDGPTDVQCKPDHLYVVFFETYGGKINGWKQYSKSGKYSARIFDVIEMPIEDAINVLEMSPDTISGWRESGNQPFIDEAKLYNFCHELRFKKVPGQFCDSGECIPNTLAGVYEWLQTYSKSDVKIDEDALGHSEGLVVRTADRKSIRKIRFEDYEKSKKAGKF